MPVQNTTGSANVVKLSADALDWALTHVETFGDTDIFPPAFEFEAIRNGWTDVRAFLERQDLLNWAIQPYRRCLSPKHRFGFRISTQLDPLDTLIFTALVFELGEDIESARIPPDARIVHSSRFMPSKAGAFFNSDFTYETFRARSLEHADRCSHVVTADIADFFPRVYSHPLENALKACTTHQLHVRALIRLLKQWNSGSSYGIPVGPAASRLLAELVISDVDNALLSEGCTFCRYVDDYRIFCDRDRTAYEALAVLAKTLFDNHGLTLQQHKTAIVDASQFVSLNQWTERDEERGSLTQRFEQILKGIGINSWYEPIEYDDLKQEIQEQIDALNLSQLLNDQITAEHELDIQIVRFVLRRLGQLGSAEAVDIVLEENAIVRLYPVFKDVLEYLSAVRKLNADRRKEIGEQILNLIDDSIVGHLEYHRCWILNTFSKDNQWDNESSFAGILQAYPDSFTKREVISALGRAHQVHWFKTAKRDFQQFGPWEKRAFIAAASCLPGDEGEFWYKSIKQQLTELERVIVEWALANPY